ncbi:hypothetical protein IC582_020622 [Cucumis melo]|uniref:Protein FLX-like 2 n=3 Tax=Cucumis melo TaxID=3656 RepID=A0A1S3CA57_CUCME|nr:protein FLX-like 2 [Cucumis melo]KAA0039397.1 protein FLX-like 2 [Cucumis melo var. makuwa]TYK00585.1 protein FLX-like 2 [Cucumis melo var. makuwa]
MGSKGRLPPSHGRRALPGSGVLHPEAFGHALRPPPGAFPPFDMLPPPEVLEQKLAGQHVEIQKLATENQRLAATHGTLRQELAAAQHELQIVHAQIGAVKSEREQQARNLSDKIAKMEAELKAAEPIKLELQQAKSDAQNLIVARQELITRVQHLTQDLQRAHGDVQQVPVLMSELESLRQEYQHCRATYDYEKKLYNDHLESLQVMEKNYITMARELEKLRAELTNTSSLERRHGGPYGTTPNNEIEASGNAAGQNTYEDSYGVAQGRGTLPATAGGASNAGATAYTGPQTGSAAARPNFDATRGPQRGPGYDGGRGSIYDSQRPGYDGQRGPGYNVPGLPTYDASRGVGYDPQTRGVAGGHAAPGNTAPYRSSTPPGRGGGFEAPSRGGGNPGRR